MLYSAHLFLIEPPPFVITGLDPVIQSFFLDGRVKPGHDNCGAILRQNENR
jgi:hypothetical protein